MMHRHWISRRGRVLLATALAAAPLLVAANSAVAQAQLFQAPAAPAPLLPLVSWSGSPVEPNDSLYRAAREALNRNEYERAAELFEELIQTAPNSPGAADAYYWRAFALYRIGGADEMRNALVALELQRIRHPNAPTRSDANALAARLRGALAREGDPAAAAELARSLEAMGRTLEVVGRSLEQVERAANLAGSVATGASEGVAACADEENAIQIAALNALRQMDASRALPLVEDVLARRDVCSAQLRRRAVFIVAQHLTEDTERILLDVARGDPDIGVRRQAVFWLSQVPTPSAIDALMEILGSAEDAELHDRAIFALSQHGDARAAGLLRQYAGNAANPTRQREQAVHWIGQKSSPESADFLYNLFTALDETRLRERILFAVSQMDVEGNIDWLLGVASDEDQPINIRKKALFHAGQAGATAERLTGIYGQVSDRELREHLIFVYSQLDDPSAFDRLLEIARDEPDSRLRQRALFWLSQSDDPRVDALLREILGGTTIP